LHGLSFSVPRGSVTGFIGPNGAGKSTTVKILSGILWSDGGSCVVGGLVPWNQRKAPVKRLGVIFGQRIQLWWDLPGGDSIALLVDELELGAFIETPGR
jgi:ABC-2 type transport system ATP-binding protein